jgi:hypothetical protein
VAIPTNFAIPVVLPTLLLIHAVASFHASAWLVRSKACLAVTFMFSAMFYPFLTVLLVWRGVPQGVLEVLTVASVIFSTWSTLRVAPMARRSDTTAAQNRLVAKAKAKDLRQAARSAVPVVLTSPLRAQIWFRLKQRMAFLSAIMVAGTVVFMVLAKIIAGPLLKGIIPSTGAHHSTLFSGGFTSMMTIVCVMMVFIMPLETSGAVRDGKFVLNPGFDPFIAIRPITTAQLTLAKLLTAVVGAIWTTIVLVAGVVLMSVTPGGTGYDLSVFMSSDAPLRRGLLVALAVLCMPLLIVSAQYYTATGNLLPEWVRKASKYLFPVAVGLSVFGFLHLVDFPLSRGADLQSIVNSILLIPTIILLAIKASLAVFGAARLAKAHLMDANTTLKCAAIWAFAWVTLTAAFHYALPPGASHPLGVSLVVALLLPANRLLWHIDLLDRTRHV